MRCKQIQESLCLGGEPGKVVREHLADCQECQAFERFSVMLDEEAWSLRTESPSRLRSAVLGGSPKVGFRVNFAAVAVTLAAVGVLAAPLVTAIQRRHEQHKFLGWNAIGDWPTYHAQEDVYLGVSSTSGPVGTITRTTQMWFDRDRSRITSYDDNGIISDEILRREIGGAVHYSRNSKGNLEKTPASEETYYPLPDDLRWEISAPAYFKDLTTTSGPNTVIAVGDTKYQVSQKTIEDRDHTAKLVYYTDLATGHILRLEHFTSVMSRDMKKVFRREFHQATTTVFYEPVHDREFDPDTLLSPTNTTVAAKPVSKG